MITLSTSELLNWQIELYERRFLDARTTEERSFLRQEVYRLRKKKNHDSSSNYCHSAFSVLGLQADMDR